MDPRPGNFIDLETREVVGRHNGIHQWTIGQRCSLAGLKQAYFVAEKLVDSGDILVVSWRLRRRLGSARLEYRPKNSAKCAWFLVACSMFIY